jgi:integrase
MRPRNSVPTYRQHRQSGQAMVRLNLGNGKTRDVLLGRHDSPESIKEYERVVAEIRAGATAAAIVGEKDTTVAELLVMFFEHAANHYRQADGTAGTEVASFKQSVRDLLHLYPHTPATEIGPRALKAVRQAMIERQWCRRQINGRIGRIRRVFKWAVSEELVPVEVYQSLCTVAGLQEGRSAAVEREAVKPVAEATVEETLPVLNRHVRGLIQFQRLTGCRPGEACRIRRRDIDQAGPVWIYRPATHKTAWRGKARAIVLGPQAQELVKAFFTDDDRDYVFSPRRMTEDRRLAMRAKRTTPVQPSQVDRAAPKPKRPPGERYNPRSYAEAVAEACEKLHPVPEHIARMKGEKGKEWHARLTADQRAELKAWRRRWRWSPNQLRHTFATTIRERFGLEAAQVLLGHARADVTQVYAERDMNLALKVAAEVG